MSTFPDTVHIGNIVPEQSVKKPRLSVPSGSVGSGSGCGGIGAAALSGGSQTGTPPISKQEEQMLRVSFRCVPWHGCCSEE